MESTPLLERPVRHGPRAYRRRIRVLGPIVALMPAGLLGLFAWWLLNDNDSSARGALGFVAALLASPSIVLAGLPLNSGKGLWVATTMASIAIWLFVGVLAARRATHAPAATWRNFWREFVWPAAGLWIGAVCAFVVADLVLGRALF